MARNNFNSINPLTVEQMNKLLNVNDVKSFTGINRELGLMNLVSSNNTEIFEENGTKVKNATNATNADYAANAANATKWNNYSLEVVTSLPSSPNAQTIYLIR